jgi:hypothetical protein
MHPDFFASSTTLSSSLIPHSSCTSSLFDLNLAGEATGDPALLLPLLLAPADALPLFLAALTGVTGPSVGEEEEGGALLRDSDSVCWRALRRAARAALTAERVERSVSYVLAGLRRLY